MLQLITLVELKVNILAMSLPHQFFFSFKDCQDQGMGHVEQIFHVVQMCYIKGFIGCKNAAFSLNYSTDISLRCCKVSKVLQLGSTAFLIIEISEFNRLIAWLLSFKAYESCQGRLHPPTPLKVYTHAHRLLNGHTSRIQIFDPLGSYQWQIVWGYL